MKRVGFFYFEEKNNDCRRQRMMKVLIVIMMAGMWCMQPEKASAADPVIRVLLTTTDFNSRYHQEITVSYDGKEITYTAEDLTRVVPSEMPATYEKEALKAQAVCARTYAWKQIQEQRLHELEADVDDTVNFQVYGNMEPQKAATEAVRETEGQILCQDGEAVEAYYFSTSAGVTSTDEIWGSDEAAPYLRSVPCKFDEEEPWSSWIVELPWKMLEDRIREKGEGTVLRSITVTRRSESGAATALEAVSDKDSCIIENEYEIREFLAPVNCMITEKDGTETAGGSLLPSAYFELERTQDGNLLVRGKGYGHGVGMSQTGADKMAEQGYDYREILDYFFRNITVENLG